MIAVYIGIIIQIIDDGPQSLSALGFFFTFGSFVVAAILHPQELTDLFYCIIYVATIPSMYLLLTVFAIFNMNDVSWGTREAPKTAAQKKAEAAEAEAAAKAKPKERTGFLGSIQSMFSKGSEQLSKVYAQKSERDNAIIEKLDSNKERLENIEKALGILSNDKSKVEENDKDSDKDPKSAHKLWSKAAGKARQKAKMSHMSNFVAAAKEKKKDDRYWSEKNELSEKRCKILADAELHILEEFDRKEALFWDNLIEEYLRPIDKDKEKEKRVKKELTDFKNNYSLGFTIVNAMWVTAIFMLQSYTSILGLKWPFGAKGPTLQFDTADLEHSNIIILNYEYLRLEPIGLVFVVAFIFVIILQSIGMMFHIIETLEQIVSHVNIRNIPSRKEKKLQIDPLDLVEKMRENYKNNGDVENQHDYVDGLETMNKKVEDFSRQLSKFK